MRDPAVLRESHLIQKVCRLIRQGNTGMSKYWKILPWEQPIPISELPVRNTVFHIVTPAACINAKMTNS